MVAQSIEGVTAPPQWGRTSPRAASTAVDQEPMDLVKRKHGQIHSELGSLSRREGEACQPQSYVCESAFIPLKTDQKHLSIKAQATPVHLVPSGLKPRKLEVLSRWQRENSEEERIFRTKENNKMSIDLQNQQLQCDIKSQEDTLKANQSMSQMKETVNFNKQFNKDTLETQKDCSIEESNEDGDQDQKQLEDYVRTLLSPVPDTSNLNCKRESLQCEAEEQGNHLIVIKDQNTVPIQNPHNSSDVSENKFIENCVESKLSPEVKETFSKGSVQQNHSELQSNFDSEKNAELNTYDYDRDGVLIIADGDCQFVENGETDTIEILNEPSFQNTQDPGKNEENPDFGQRSRSRSESQRKMKEGKRWLLNNLLVVASTASVIKLSAIEEAYIADCKENGKEPLSTPVLARLIHSTFPDASKCRLGARGSQRIHYRRLGFKSDITLSSQNDQSVNVRTKSFDQNGQKKAHSKMNPWSAALQNQSKVKGIAQKSVGLKDVINTETTQMITQETTQMTTRETTMIEATTQILNNDTESRNVSFTPFEVRQPSQKNQCDLAQNDEENCKRAAKKVKEVLQWITKQGQNHRLALLRDFAHSASCQKSKCEHICLMFRRIRRHVVAAKHSCHVLRLYSMLLRHHVSTCNQDNCGLPACPALRKTCGKRKGEEERRQLAKRTLAIPTLNSARFPLSPDGSLPGSPVNSPPLSPNSFVGMTPLTMAQTPQSSIGSLPCSPMSSPSMSPTSIHVEGMTPLTDQGVPVQYVVVQVPMVMRLVDTQGA